MNDLERIKLWIDTYGGSTSAAITAGLQLAGALTKNNPDKRPQEILTGIPTADQAIAQSAGVAEIAGEYGVEMSDVLEFASLLLSLGLTFIV